MKYKKSLLPKVCQKYTQDIPKISPRYSQDIPIFYRKSSKVLDLLAHCSFPLFVRELFTAVCHSPTISFREHLATAICNPAAPPSFYYSDFLHSITFEEGTTPHDRYQDKYLWRHGDYGSMLRGQREKEAGKRCINLSMCMICVIVPGWAHPCHISHIPCIHLLCHITCTWHGHLWDMCNTLLIVTNMFLDF